MAAVVVLVAIVSIGVGLAVGEVMIRRTRRLVGPSWEEWRYAKQMGGRWAPLIGIAVFAATSVGFYGFGASDVVRAALLGAVGGSCVPFAAEGTRRYMSRGRVGG